MAVDDKGTWTLSNIEGTPVELQALLKGLRLS